MQDIEYIKKDLSIQCIQYVMFVTLYMCLLLQEEQILHFRETQWVFSFDVSETLVLYFLSSSFTLKKNFTFDNILYAQKHPRRLKMVPCVLRIT